MAKPLSSVATAKWLFIKTNKIKYMNDGVGIYISDISILEQLKEDPSYKWFVQVYSKTEGKFILEPFDKEKSLFLSWYGPSAYIIKNLNNEYRYILSDQNFIYSYYGVGFPTKKKTDFPKSLPILIKYK